jgi:hypothetical protein
VSNIALIEAIAVTMRNLTSEGLAVRERVKDIEAAVRSLQKICPHKFVDDGRDSHHTYQVCAVCGHEERDG